MSSNPLKLAVALAAFLAAIGPSFGQEVAEPQGYRMDAYKAPVPKTLTGAKVVSTAEAKRLWEGGRAVFVDVLPRPPKPALPEGTVWRDKPRHDIPGSVWLPDVGHGAIAPETERYFRDNLAAATDGDKSRTIVLYCLSNCWMSWNAAKRALELGHTDVVWYPEGTDGWAGAKLPLEERTPEPRPGQAATAPSRSGSPLPA